jgi:Na+-driven multidrug efflux pump
MAAAFTLLVLLFGQLLYSVLGGEAETLGQALRYSNVVFAGAIAVWAANTLSSVLRGTGNMALPAAALIVAAAVHIPLSAALTARMGIAGAGVAYVAGFGLAALAMACVVFRRGSALRPRAADLRLEPRLFADILRVGGISALSAVQTVLTAVIVTGFVGRHGAAALAGYGVGLRLELLQIPLVFAVGQSMVVLVGTHIGAGRAARAKRIAWTGAAMAAGFSLVVGMTVALAPLAWVGLFSEDAAVLESGSQYLRSVAPFYPLLAAGIALYFASQGAGRVLWPVLAGSARLVLVLAGGMLVASLPALFAVIAGAMAVFGLLTIWFIARAEWS